MDITKTLVQGVDFTFDASAQTITFAGFTPVQAQILVISNVTDNIIIYSSSVPATKGVLSGQVLTLTYDTTAMADNDKLQIRYASTDAVAISAAALPLPTDAATQTTLAAILAKILAAPSTEAKQDVIIGHIDTLETAFTTLNAKDFATQTTLAALLTQLQDLVENGSHEFLKVGGWAGGANYSIMAVDSNGNVQVDVLSSALPTGAATAANQATLIAKDFATQTTLAAVLAKIIAAPATEAKQDTLITSNAAIQTAVQLIDNAISGNEMQVDVITLPSIPAGTNNIGDVDVLSLPALPAGTNNIGDVDVLTLPALAAGTNLIGKVNIDPATSGGLTTYHLVSAASTNATSVKGSAGQVFGWYIYNSNAAARKVTFHNASGTPTAGASVFFSLVIPPLSGANVFNETGIAFSSGIGITTVTGLADSDSTGVALNDLVINIFYK